ncbi:MAG: hypothetical protein K6T65_00195 [Peptococcaceae bacterium]|nr:hypothetical protein [Peptococcaceae bacterium]
MDPYMSVLFMLTISFPEAMLVSYLVIQFMGWQPRLAEIVLIGLIEMVVAYIVRTSPVPFGVHTLLQVFSTMILISIITRIPLYVVAAGILMVGIFYIAVDIFIFQLLLGITGMTTQDVVNHHYMRIFFFAPSAAVLLVAIVLCKKHRITFARIFGWK